MSKESKHDNNQETVIRAATQVYGLLPHLAGAIVGLSALTYFIGWQYLSAYYRGMGVHWAVSLLSSAQILRESSVVAFTIGGAGFFSFLMKIEKGKTAKWLFNVSDYFFIGAGCLSLLSLLLKSFFSISIYNNISITVSILYAVTAGLTFGVLIASLAEGGLKWRGVHFSLIFFIIVYGMFHVPQNLGSTHANIDRQEETSRLPTVNMENTSLDEDWRLLEVFGNQALLIGFTEKSESRKFKIVNLIDIKIIESEGKKPDNLYKDAQKPKDMKNE